MLKSRFLKFNLFISHFEKEFTAAIDFIIIYKVFYRLNFINKIYKLVIRIKDI